MPDRSNGGPSHRDIAYHHAAEARDIGLALFALTHALLAIEDRLDVIAYALAQGADTRRRPADSTTETWSCDAAF